jgi:hypothetical protein
MVSAALTQQMEQKELGKSWQLLYASKSAANEQFLGMFGGWTYCQKKTRLST